MKTLIVILLIQLCMSSPFFHVDNHTETAFEAVEAFFDAIGLDQIDDLVVKTDTDLTQVNKLFWDVWDDFEHSDRSWNNTADSVAKIGKIMDVLATNIKVNAENDKLNEQIGWIKTYLSNVKANPGNFIYEVKRNILRNFLKIGWEIIDIKKLYLAQRFREFGTRLGNLAVSIFKGADTPDKVNTLRMLVGHKKKNLRRRRPVLKYAECFKKASAMTFELFKIVANVEHINFSEAFRLLGELFQVIRNCRA